MTSSITSSSPGSRLWTPRIDIITGFSIEYITPISFFLVFAQMQIIIHDSPANVKGSAPPSSYSQKSGHADSLLPGRIEFLSGYPTPRARERQDFMKKIPSFPWVFVDFSRPLPLTIGPGHTIIDERPKGGTISPVIAYHSRGEPPCAGKGNIITARRSWYATGAQ